MEHNTNICTVIVCFCVLSTAIILENFFGIVPCELCKYNRMPYVAITFLTVFSYLILERHRYIKTIFHYGVLISIIIGLGLTTYQVGIEFAWWNEVTSCTGDPTQAMMTLEEMLAGINEPYKSCSDPDRFFGITLAQMNFVPLLTLLGIWVWRKRCAG